MHSIGHRAGIGNLARRTGVSKTHVSRIFNHTRQPSLKVARRLAEALQVSLDELYDHLNDDHQSKDAA